MSAKPLRRAPLHTARALRQFAQDWDQLPDQAFDVSARALARACRALRACVVEPRRQQVLAAAALLDQRLVEMDTGEGKTYAVALAAAAAALLGAPVHVVTANDYLAARDAARLQPFYASLGLRCGVVTERTDPDARREAYAAHITYVPARELAFDFLRDSVGSGVPQSVLEQRAAAWTEHRPPVLRGLCVALLDEADSLLVDEARLPLVLAGAAGAGLSRGLLEGALAIARTLREGEHYTLGARADRVRLLTAGSASAAAWQPAVRSTDVLASDRRHREQLVTLALHALHLLHDGRDYVLQAGRVVIVDPVTGRPSAERSWAQGLHQLVEIKEGARATAPNETLADITFQGFFSRYVRLAGISGTLREARGELRRLHGLAFLRVPPHVPRRVLRFPDRMFRGPAALWPAVAARAIALADAGRPVLVGVHTVDDAAVLSALLDGEGRRHQVLDARHSEAEHDKLAQAGGPGRITIATSMAGRGSDIPLKEREQVAGGLHVLLCQFNRSQRTDRQFLGRAGRQGQPGTCERWVAANVPAIEKSSCGRLAQLLASNATARVHGWFLQCVQMFCTYTDSIHRVTNTRRREQEEGQLAFRRDLPP